jgi:hypothetical protein
LRVLACTHAKVFSARAEPTLQAEGPITFLILEVLV